MSYGDPTQSKEAQIGREERPGRPACPEAHHQKRSPVRLLKASAGREIATLSRELGWQPHTTRAALTRLRKAGYAIEKLPPQNDGASRYRIAAEPVEPTP